MPTQTLNPATQGSAGRARNVFSTAANVSDHGHPCTPFKRTREASHQEITSAFRSLGVGLGRCERALNEYCWPVTLSREIYDRLFALGIRGLGVSGRGPFDALQFSDVIFRPAGRFDFAGEIGLVREQVGAIIIPARDETGEIIDLVAWNTQTGALALWSGDACMLGADQLTAPRVDMDALPVFPDAAAWLRAGRRGLVIIDPKRARWLTAETPLAVEDDAFGARLSADMKLPEPQIFVVCKAARAAK
jgi:hypothetical protein